MFVYSLPLFFTEIRWLSLFEALIIASGLFVLVYITTPEVITDRRPESGSYLFSSWTGNSNLSAVFWPFFLLLNGLLYSLDTLIKAGYLTVSSWDDIHFVLLFPVIWWTVGIWRCSVHTDSRFWAAGARLATIGVGLEYALKLYIRIDYPRLFFNCEEALLDFGSCF
jgi:hypothetical protein